MASDGYNRHSDGRAGGRNAGSGDRQRPIPEFVGPGSGDNVRQGPAEDPRLPQDQTSSERKAAVNAESDRNPRDRQGIQQQQQHSASGSELVSGSGSDPESQPAAALPLPSWRQQERLEPEQEAPRSGHRADDRPRTDHRAGARSQARPFSRSGSHHQQHVQSANQDAPTSSRSHHRAQRSLEKPVHQSASGRRHHHDRSSGNGSHESLPSPAAFRGRQDRSPFGNAGLDRSRFHQRSPELQQQQSSRVGDTRGHQHFHGQLHTDRQYQQQSQVSCHSAPQGFARVLLSTITYRDFHLSSQYIRCISIQFLAHTSDSS